MDIKTLDIDITQWINTPAGSNPLLDTVFVSFTHFGIPLMVVLVILQWWTKQDRMHVRHAAFASGLSFLLALAINHAILLFMHRIRPYDAGITHLITAPNTDWSFPSDHATASIAIVAALAMQYLPRRTLGLLIIALLVCWSRVYVGIHYITDVLGGACTGMLGAIIIRLVYREDSRIDKFVTHVL